MKMGNILTKSFKYPFNDFKNFLVVCVLFLLPALPLFALRVLGDNAIILCIVLSLLLLFIDILIIPGYFVSVVKSGCDNPKSVPSIKLGKNIVDSFKKFILDFIYGLVPFIVFVVGIIISGMYASNSDQLLFSFMIVLVITAILSVIFSLFSSVATARLAKYDSLSKAFSFGEVFADVKRIGFWKVLAWYILMGIIVFLIAHVVLLLVFIPYVGLIIYFAFIIPYIISVYYCSLGLLYSNVDGSGKKDGEVDLDEFEREIQEIKMMI
ncbi:MAG: DUF4013 domain-containing protein [Methanobrevibacter sp.]|nr:DUF4013 domain-containing protein [Methanobrevibacter sp.]